VDNEKGHEAESNAVYLTFPIKSTANAKIIFTQITRINMQY